MLVLETKDITKRFGGLLALDKVSIQVEKGEIHGLIGPNGSGKTTFLNAVAGMDPPTSGSVSFYGEETKSLSPEEMCHRGLSRTFQIPRPFPKMTALENVMVSAVFGRGRNKSSDAVLHAREQLEFVEFNMPEGTISESLNTVQLKRLDLARALASSPKMLLLDELACGLTETEIDDLMRIIRKISKKGTTILIVEHIMQVIMNLCDRLTVLNFGKTISQGPTKIVAHDSKVIEAYFGSEALQ